MPFLNKLNRTIVLYWYYVLVDKESLTFRCARSSEMDTRPPDANPSSGNIYTPWYKEEEHLDESHVHIKAGSEEEAITRAERLYREKFLTPHSKVCEKVTK